MDTIKFVIEDYIEEEFGYRFPVINIYINEINLIHLASAVESKVPIEEIAEDPWRYIGYEGERFERLRSEMLGEKQYHPFNILLTCTCTFAECSCLSATITFNEKTVTWSDVKNPWFSAKLPNPWTNEAEAEEIGWIPIDYSGLGPFVFNKEQYLSALEQVTEECYSRKLHEPPTDMPGNSLFGLLDLFPEDQPE